MPNVFSAADTIIIRIQNKKEFQMKGKVKRTENARCDEKYV